MADESVPITLTVDKAGNKRTFDAPKDFHEWLRSEVPKWQWIADARSANANLKPVLIAQLHPLVAELGQLDAKVSSLDAYQQQATNTAVEISARTSKRKLLLSEDPAGAFVLGLVGERRQTAAFALAYLTRTPIAIAESPDDAFEAKFLASAFEIGLHDSAVAEKSALSGLIQEYRSAIESLRTESGVVTARHEELQKTFDAEVKKAAGKFAEAEDARRIAAQEALKSYEDRFEQLRTAFLEHMKLQAPVEYWSRSAFWHRVTAGVYGVIAIVWGLLVGLKVYNVTMALIAEARTAQGQDPPYWEIGLLVFLLTLAIWLLRVLVRMTLSSLHQGADARSRATMTEAYLALIEGGKALPEKDRILVLTSLFRPMATGLIKDDGMPPSISELLSRIVGGKGGPS